MMAQLVSGRSALLTVLLWNPFRGVDSLIGLGTRVMGVSLNQENNPSHSLSCSSSALIFSKGPVSGARGRPSMGSYVHCGSVG